MAIYRIGRALDRLSEVRAAACSVSALRQLKSEHVLTSPCNVRCAGVLRTMTGCALGLANARPDSRAICARALAGRIGELPANRGFGSSDRKQRLGGAEEQLAPSLDASGQSVALLRKHFHLTISHYFYSNTPWAASLGKINWGRPRVLRGQAPMFRLIPYATRASPEAQGDLRPIFAKTDRARPKCDASVTAGGTADRSMGGELETWHSCRGIMPPRCGRTPRQCPLERG